MTNTFTSGPWYRASNTIQGLVISEVTGANIAVTYDPNDADLIAAAPELLGALVELVQSAEYIYRSHGNEISGTFKLWQDIVRAQSAINKAKGIK